MIQEYSIRKAHYNNLPEMRDLFVDTIRSVNKKDYTAEEVEDWVFRSKQLSRWQDLFTEHMYYICLYGNKIVGFTSLNDSGYIHSLFVHKDFQRKGIASALFEALYLIAKEMEIPKLSADVSITAKPFFLSKGFEIIIEKKSRAFKLYLKNYLMALKIE